MTKEIVQTGVGPRRAERTDRPPASQAGALRPQGGGDPGGTLEEPPASKGRVRHLRVGVSHPSDDPARHRSFEVRASYRAGVGWVADLTEENLNDQLQSAAVSMRGTDHVEAFPTAAACLGHAVAMLVRTVDGDAAETE